MITPLNQIRCIHPTALSDMPDKLDNNQYVIGQKNHTGNKPSSVEHSVEIINRTNQEVYIKDREGFASKLGRYVGKDRELYLPGKIYIVKRSRTHSGTNTTATTTLGGLSYYNSVQVFEIDPMDTRYQTNNPIFLPRFNLLLAFGIDLTNYPYPEPYQQAMDEFVKDIKSNLPELTCHLGVYIVDNESTNHQYYLNSWGRVFKVNVIRDPTKEDGVYIYQNNIPVKGEQSEWLSHSTYHRLESCLFTHKDKKIHAPITLFLDPELALQHGSVATIQEERYNAELRELKQKEIEDKKELLNLSNENQRLKAEAENRKAKQDKTKGLMGLITAVMTSLTALLTIVRAVSA